MNICVLSVSIRLAVYLSVLLSGSFDLPDNTEASLSLGYLHPPDQHPLPRLFLRPATTRLRLLSGSSEKNLSPLVHPQERCVPPVSVLRSNVGG